MAQSPADFQTKFDALLDEFESDFSDGIVPNIEHFLSKHSIQVGEETSIENLDLLASLIEIQIERFWADTQNEPADDDSPTIIGPTTDRFVNQFPVLRKFPSIVARLAAFEAGVRGDVVRTTGDDDVPSEIAGYELLEPIASGGMGIVWKARSSELKCDVALKLVLQQKLLGSESKRRLYEQRFVNEAKAAARLVHPNIVQFLTFQKSAGRLFYVMELIDGESLRQKLRAHNDCHPREAVHLVIQVAEAIGYAHRLGVIHRDLKPENILITRAGVPKVADFGLAKLTDSESKLTQDHEQFGTREYMAPEQFRDTAHVTVAADIYSMGALLLELLTGSVPFRFEGNYVAFLRQVDEETPVLPARLRSGQFKDLGVICLKALAKEPKRRYATANEFADDLSRWIDGRPIAARKVSVAERAWLWCRRNPIIGGLTAAAIALLIIAGVQTIDSFRNSVLAREQQNARRIAVSDFYIRLNEHEAFRHPGFEDVILEFMESGKEYLDTGHEALDAMSLEERTLNARLYFVNGWIAEKNGQSEKAEQDYAAAQAIQEQLLDGEGGKELKIDLSNTLNSRGWLLRTTDAEKSREYLLAASNLRRDLVDSIDSNDTSNATEPKELRRKLANVLLNLAVVQREDFGDSLESQRLCNEASKLGRTLPPDEKATLRLLAETEYQLAILSSKQEDAVQTLAHFQNAESHLNRVTNLAPWDVDARHRLASTILGILRLSKLNVEWGARCDNAIFQTEIAMAASQSNLPFIPVYTKLNLEYVHAMAAMGNFSEASDSMCTLLTCLCENCPERRVGRIADWVAPSKVRLQEIAQMSENRSPFLAAQIACLQAFLHRSLDERLRLLVDSQVRLEGNQDPQQQEWSNILNSVIVEMNSNNRNPRPTTKMPD